MQIRKHFYSCTIKPSMLIADEANDQRATDSKDRQIVIGLNVKSPLARTFYHHIAKRNCSCAILMFRRNKSQIQYTKFELSKQILKRVFFFGTWIWKSRTKFFLNYHFWNITQRNTVQFCTSLFTHTRTHSSPFGVVKALNSSQQ